MSIFEGARCYFIDNETSVLFIIKYLVSYELSVNNLNFEKYGTILMQVKFYTFWQVLVRIFEVYQREFLIHS